MPSIGFDGREHDARDDFAYRRNLILLFFFADLIYWAIALNLLSPLGSVTALLVQSVLITL